MTFYTSNLSFISLDIVISWTKRPCDIVVCFFIKFHLPLVAIPAIPTQYLSRVLTSCSSLWLIFYGFWLNVLIFIVLDIWVLPTLKALIIDWPLLIKVHHYRVMCQYIFQSTTYPDIHEEVVSKSRCISTLNQWEEQWRVQYMILRSHYQRSIHSSVSFSSEQDLPVVLHQVPVVTEVLS